MDSRPSSADALVQRLRDTLAARADEPSEVLVHEQALPAEPPSLGVLRPRLPAALARALLVQGVSQLYAHQVATVEAVRNGQNVVLASPTASGKSLAFALPTLERALLTPGARALYLYPTKALIGDQLRALEALLAALPLDVAARPRVAVLSGDVARERRVELAADPPDILLANPDILHHSLLPDHRRWRALLANLQIVVIDELHSYRGVFGAHVSLVLRRLRRLAAAYGAQPTFVAASATIANPVELAEQVVGLPFVEIRGDTAGSGPRRFLFWRPPLRGDASANEHESVFAEAAAVFAEALRAGYSGILFGRARVSVERMLLDVRRLVGPELASQVSAYKSGYRADERSHIEAGLRSGLLRGVVSTNALELGIDVGALDVAVLAGYPGSSMSFWQQAGRVGRRADREAVVVLVAGDDAMDQYHVQHPEAFFGRPMEQAAVDPSNASIQLGHLVCAAAERPLTADDFQLWPENAPRLVDRLVSAGELSAGPPWRAAGSAVHGDVSLRGTSRHPYTLQGGGNFGLGSIEPPHLQRECYPGALYLHNGRGYRVQSIDAFARVVHLEEESTDTRTTPLVEVRVAPRDTPFAVRQLKLGEAELVATVGPLQVRETIGGYRESRRGQSFTASLDEPLESTLETTGVWLDLPQALESDDASLHALEHGLVNALPLALLCDRRDIGSSSSPEDRRLYIYDFAEGGIGLAEKAFHVLETLFDRAAALLRDCPCAEGCPSCMHLTGCPRGNSALDKVGGLALLEGRGVGGARTADRLLRPSREQAAASFDAPARQRRLRAIADADLRERYGGRPNWLEIGGLAQHQLEGLVVVWSIGRGSAEVQSLSGGESHWVKLSDLSPPSAS
ncbi:MAG TPA: DEAD/DEAH box helicase [Chloroflexota bacterium]|jgi:DEAD/DEAH box helicase domain-containing protein|nr:DEAD/DEAH box helicase [Chloroflexota bacterium]